MPLVGIDWSQTRVAHLFSDIKVCPPYACVLNVVSGFGPTAGAALASHMEVDKVLNNYNVQPQQ